MTLECFERDKINPNNRRGIATAGTIIRIKNIEEFQFRKKEEDLDVEYETFGEAYLDEEYGFGKPITL